MAGISASRPTSFRQLSIHDLSFGTPPISDLVPGVWVPVYKTIATKPTSPAATPPTRETIPTPPALPDLVVVVPAGLAAVVAPGVEPVPAPVAVAAAVPVPVPVAEQ